jgi:hypothetical protein
VQQAEFAGFAAASGSTMYVSDRASFRTEGTQRVICVHGVVLAHYEVGDRAAEAYAMTTLCESGYATQRQIARSFGYATRSLRRYQERLNAGGIGALARDVGRPVVARIGNRKDRGRDQTILHLKAKGFSNRGVAGRLGLSETAIRKRLRRLGWKPLEQPSLSFQQQPVADAIAATETAQRSQRMFDSASAGTQERHSTREEDGAVESEPTSVDPDPLDRSMDRLRAQWV